LNTHLNYAFYDMIVIKISKTEDEEDVVVYMAGGTQFIYYMYSCALENDYGDLSVFVYRQMVLIKNNWTEELQQRICLS
jgi:hypothetical protein